VIDGLYVPPKPAIILPKPKEFARPGDPKVLVPFALAGMIMNPYRFSVAAATIAFTDHAVDATNQTTYTFTNRAVSTAAANRKVVVAASAGSGSNPTVSSMTIGGIAASLVTGAKIGNVAEAVEFWQADVPTGTTATIAVTWSGGLSSCGIQVFAVYGASAAATDTDTNSSANPTVVAIDVPAGGVCMGAIVHRANSATTYIWSGITEASGSDEVMETDTNYHAAGFDAFASAQTGLSVQCTASQAGVRNHLMAVAAFGPA
jgi:hypothetical protein